MWDPGWGQGTHISTSSKGTPGEVHLGLGTVRLVGKSSDSIQQTVRSSPCSALTSPGPWPRHLGFLSLSLIHSSSGGEIIAPTSLGASTGKVPLSDRCCNEHGCYWDSPPVPSPRKSRIWTLKPRVWVLTGPLASSMTLDKSFDPSSLGLNFPICKMKTFLAPLIGSLRGANKETDQETALGTKTGVK